MIRLLVAALLFVLAGCGGSDVPVAPSSPIDVTLTLAPGQTLFADSANSVGIRFDTVTEDSRCPLNAMCVWQGRAVAKVTVVAATTSTTVDIHSDPAAARAVSVGHVRVEWQQLAPYPYTIRPTQPGDYRLTVRVKR